MTKRATRWAVARRAESAVSDERVACGRVCGKKPQRLSDILCSFSLTFRRYCMPMILIAARSFFQWDRQSTRTNPPRSARVMPHLAAWQLPSAPLTLPGPTRLWLLGQPLVDLYRTFDTIFLIQYSVDQPRTYRLFHCLYRGTGRWRDG